MITVTENAVEHLKRCLEEDKKADYGLRVSVVGGGCSGMSYKLDFEKDPNPDDKVIEQNGIRLFIDPKSALFVKDLELDYSGGLNGTGFQFKNPNASKSCGCGLSFSV